MREVSSSSGNGRRRRRNEENIVQWKQNNIKDGFVVVDEAQLTKLIKREPISKYYKLEEQPFATGLFASVRRCESLTTGEKFAAKFSSRKRYGEDCSAEIYHEIALLSLCGSARVIQIHDVFETATQIILVMEYAPGGDLQTIIDDNQVPYESDVVTYIRQSVEGLEYLHQRKIAHLDIKPQNIVMMGQFPNCDIKLCDLEISRVILDGSEIREILGTPDYVAPEILHYDPITLAADMWSLGVTTYVLLTGFSPFGGETDQETFCNISRGELDLTDELFEDISPNAIDFIRALLVKDPKQRPSASACLKHPWLAHAPRKLPQPPPSPSSLRKFLSKSREALFDKVVQQHRNTLRKHTLQSQMLRTTRLYESQMSLVSKSRERMLNKMCPSFSRSIEKIYGLRSLSKSQEVLNLYKNGSLMTSQENINSVVTEILRSRENLLERDEGHKAVDRKLTRATTTDLGILRHRHRKARAYSGSSTTSLASDVAEELEDRIGDAALDDTDKASQDRLNEGEGDKFAGSRVDFAQNPEFSNETASEKEPYTEIKPLQLPESKAMERDKLEDSHSVPPEHKTNEIITEVPKEEVTRTEESVGSLANGKSDGVLVNGKARRSSNADDGTEVSKNGSVEEPRFTVAQLITAFNKHQEVVTKSSLEVTMSAEQKERPPYSAQVPFPTGPTALRLFIPDIHLVHLPARNRPNKPVSPHTPLTAPVACFITPFAGESTRECATVTDIPTYLRSASLSSDTSTAVSTEDNSTTPETSLEPVPDKPPAPARPSSLRVSATRSKSQSPSPVNEPEKPPHMRKLSAGSNAEPRKEPVRKLSSAPIRKPSVEKSPLPQRRLSSLEPSPAPQRKKLESPTPARKTSTGQQEFKIVGLGERSKKGHGISYKIEFASPVVTRRFPVRTPGVCAKTTISSELKKQDSINKAKRK